MIDLVHMVGQTIASMLKRVLSNWNPTRSEYNGRHGQIGEARRSPLKICNFDIGVDDCIHIGCT